VKPAAFEYHRAASLDDALALLARHPDAKPLAGGQSLIPAMNFRLAQPGALVDLNAVAELAGITTVPAGGGTGLRIGAMTRHVAVERSAEVRSLAPLLAEAMPHVAHPQIRSRGTLGGSLAHADPSAELPAVMLALDATFVLRGPAARERRVRAEDFFSGMFATVLEPGELLVAVEIPAGAPRSGSAFMEVARRHGDYALAGVAVQLSLDDGRVADARVALLSVGDRPVLARAAGALVGQSPTPERMASIADAVRDEVDPPSDIHADAAYRRQLAGVLTRRAITLAARRAGATS
jgi:aerobic carbon-monoxide dehydrogenase medium subunit